MSSNLSLKRPLESSQRQPRHHNKDHYQIEETDRSEPARKKQKPLSGNPAPVLRDWHTPDHVVANLGSLKDRVLPQIQPQTSLNSWISWISSPWGLFGRPAVKSNPPNNSQKYPNGDKARSSNQSGSAHVINTDHYHIKGSHSNRHRPARSRSRSHSSEPVDNAVIDLTGSCSSDSDKYISHISRKYPSANSASHPPPRDYRQTTPSSKSLSHKSSRSHPYPQPPLHPFCSSVSRAKEGSTRESLRRKYQGSRNGMSGTSSKHGSGSQKNGSNSTGVGRVDHDQVTSSASPSKGTGRTVRKVIDHEAYKAIGTSSSNINNKGKGREQDQGRAQSPSSAAEETYKEADEDWSAGPIVAGGDRPRRGEMNGGGQCLTSLRGERNVEKGDDGLTAEMRERIKQEPISCSAEARSSSNATELGRQAKKQVAAVLGSKDVLEETEGEAPGYAETVKKQWQDLRELRLNRLNGHPFASRLGIPRRLAQPLIGEQFSMEQHERDVEKTLKARNESAFDKVDEIDASFMRNLKIKDDKAEEAIKRKLAASRRPALPLLTKAEMQEVEEALVNKRFKSKCDRAEIEWGSIRRLEPGTWLDDEVINFYGALIQKRADEDLVTGKDGKKVPRRKVHFLNSFLFAKMLKDGYTNALARWTKKVDLFEKDILILPINLGNAHWVCAAINFVDKRFEFYDSYSSDPRQDVYEILREYIQGESLDKKKKNFDFTDWVDHWDRTAPQQQNGVDCGVFTCQTLEHRGRGIGDAGATENGMVWEFEQRHIPHIRRLMVHEIKSAKLKERGPPPARELE